ncbi:hypothetical protein ACOSQ2_024293 [Xanthoceras sorbifolium]|uniref:Uncharacterized protein n=1 Tax=Xanthoceras sorbifolium TaxID=99658 RepID=A0ABQ8H9K1_9ROSI|nr:hypothetical protein JRO89_XS13G0226900 [Xanthoceras sorbifolium]
MALYLKNSPSCALKNPRENPFSSLTSSLLKPRSSTSVGFWNCNFSYKNENRNRLQACFFSPIDEPILKEALKEPIAFAGGMFAGLLRLDLKEDPLKEWVTRTVDASGITEEEIDADAAKPEEETPEQIEIE